MQKNDRVDPARNSNQNMIVFFYQLIGIQDKISIKSNDKFWQEYDVNYKTIRRLVLLNNGKEEDAKDIFQETLLT